MTEAPAVPVVKPDSLHDTFEEAADRATVMKDLANDVKLQMYGLFKQATVGDCTLDEPSRWNMVNHSKWKAWRKLAGMTETGAKQAYIDLVAALDPDFEANTNVHASPSLRNPTKAPAREEEQSPTDSEENPQISIIVENPTADKPRIIVEEKDPQGSPVQIANIEVDDPSAPVNINIEPASAPTTPSSSLIRHIRAVTSTSESPVPTWLVFFLGVLFLCFLDDNVTLGNMIMNSLGVSVLTAMLISLQR